MKSKVLTCLQEKVLVTLFDHGLGELGYFLTGGTALSEFYLQHRHSDDLDFFTRRDRDPAKDLRMLRDILISNGLEITHENLGGDHIRLDVSFADHHTEPLRVDLAREVPAIMAPTQVHGKVLVDSFEDIAVNKTCAIFGRSPRDLKDYIDLYFILEESDYSVNYLLNRAAAKDRSLEQEDGILYFATNLMAVVSFPDLLKAKMIKPLTLEALKARLTPIARDMLNRLRPGGT